MARRNSRDVRFDGMTQRQLQRLERQKKSIRRRYDLQDWTTRIFEKLQEGDKNEA